MCHAVPRCWPAVQHALIERDCSMPAHLQRALVHISLGLQRECERDVQRCKLEGVLYLLTICPLLPLSLAVLLTCRSASLRLASPPSDAEVCGLTQALHWCVDRRVCGGSRPPASPL